MRLGCEPLRDWPWKAQPLSFIDLEALGHLMGDPMIPKYSIEIEEIVLFCKETGLTVISPLYNVLRIT